MAKGIAAVLKEKKNPVPLDHMTLRDFFAAFALLYSKEESAEDAAKHVYDVAEAMLEERAKR